MPRYGRVAHVADFHQAGEQADFGVLGNLVTDDWIYVNVGGDILTMTNSHFTNNYAQVSQNTALTGARQGTD